MVTPAKSDFQGVPMNAEAAGRQHLGSGRRRSRGLACKSYGAPAIMRVPDARISRGRTTGPAVDIDAGMQTRLFRFGAAPAGTATRPGRAMRRAVGVTKRSRWCRAWRPRPMAPRKGPVRLKVMTKHCGPDTLRKNGVPYSDQARLTEYFDVVQERNGDAVARRHYRGRRSPIFTQPFITSTQFKKQADAAGWETRHRAPPCGSLQFMEKGQYDSFEDSSRLVSDGVRDLVRHYGVRASRSLGIMGGPQP